MRPSVLIVIVNYRTTRLVIECLRSLDRGGLPGLSRVVVVDNLSGDGAVEELGAAIQSNGWASWAELLPSDRNGGFAAGNNLAIRRELSKDPDSQPRYVYLLNPDTLVRTGAVGAMAGFLDQHPEVGVVGSRIEDLDGRAQGSARRFPTPLGEFEAAARFGPISRLLGRHRISIPDADHPLRCDWVSGAAMMIRFELFSTVGLFDEGYFLYFEETDFCRRVARAGGQIWYVPQSKVVHFEGSSTGIRKENRRRPRYWYESRRRYLVKALGLRGWVQADCGWALGRLVWTVQKLSGWVRCWDDDPRGFAADLLGGDWRAVLSGSWRRNLELPASGPQGAPLASGIAEAGTGAP